MMKLIKSMMISCEKATFLMSKKEEGILTIGEYLILFFHLSMCKFCQLFEKQSAYISKQAKHFHSTAELSAESKSQIAKALEQE
ncbi:MAG: hypothetical protein HY063_10815 [Bacteroidetes bacterium]|nr:hypothetical protein [Bacteroidota bacterium]